MEQSMPPITVSSLDLERIEELLDSDSFRRLAGRDALQAELDRASVVDPEEVPADLVTMNSTVVVLDEDSNMQSELTLVYPNSPQPANPVSVLAPVGSALLGLSIGQSISWPLPGGRALRLRVLDVKNQPEASGKYYR
ncbi:nucleoside diphosphate kinase regulator [Noviherbaspirillum sedimenti]|uniref:Nucleoside diphosphate kinase regulator n=2 Tax=Noviherbaspirillum sedimenti TaxID=2320865 RepID=A0A3A3G7Y3_9BURK|nr:nucleoside diphosphate kinase regulator [Noviherbaspirillum sedimenti]